MTKTELVLYDACKYTFNNLEKGYEEGLITAPKFLHAQLGESMKMLETAIRLVDINK